MEGTPRVRFGDAVKKALNGYKDYGSRSRRSEYWFWALFVFLCSLVVMVIAMGINKLTGSDYGNILAYIFDAVVFFVFSLPLAVRRLHDTGRSGWFMLLILIPLVGAIILIIFFVTDSVREQNQWGPSPKYSGSTDGFLPSETV